MVSTDLFFGYLNTMSDTKKIVIKPLVLDPPGDSKPDSESESSTDRTPAPKHSRSKKLFTGESAFNMYDSILKTYDPLASNIVNKRKDDYTKVFDDLLHKYKTFDKLEKLVVHNPEIKLAYYAASDGFMYAKLRQRTPHHVNTSTKSNNASVDTPINQLFNILD
jgi:hypothetical protein